MRREHALPPDMPLCFIRGNCLKKPDANAAEAMVNALKSSASAYVGTTFCFVDVTMPDVTRSYQAEVVEAAVKASGLRQLHRTLSAGKIAVWANQPKDIEILDEQIALAIDYSRSGLNLNMFCYDTGIVDEIRHDFNPRIWADNTDLDAARAALKRISQPPFPDCPMVQEPLPDLHSKIDYIVLYGDSVFAKEFLQVVTDVLGAEGVTEARAWEPVSVAALGAAENSFNTQNSMYFSDKPAFGCRWRSGLYSGDAQEL
jgi:hypothetical protein